MKGYTTRQKIENYLLITIDASFYDQVTAWIEEVEKYIDNLTGRSFAVEIDEDDSTGGLLATERVYDGDGTTTILIDDCVGVTKLEIDGDEATEFVTYPANTLPKTKLKLTAGRFTRGTQNIKVTAQWGYSATPPGDITTAATVLVAGIINYSLNADGEVQNESIGRYSVTYKAEKQWQDFERVEEILKYYKKYYF
jgi:hypothetical protein